jgi:hypothetical protein
MQGAWKREEMRGNERIQTISRVNTWSTPVFTGPMVFPCKHRTMLRDSGPTGTRPDSCQGFQAQPMGILFRPTLATRLMIRIRGRFQGDSMQGLCQICSMQSLCHVRFHDKGPGMRSNGMGLCSLRTTLTRYHGAHTGRIQ